LDIDLLLFGDGNIHSPALQVPHPRMRERAFVLLPLSELAPGLVTKDELRKVQSQVVKRL
jgi:2-amino-4-hydroxy-6-hydroxymethyldihydropteridine diphosphokinase